MIAMTSAAGDAKPAQDAGALLSDYEKLRGEALRLVGGPGRGSGLVLFIRRGMAAWLTACASVTPALEARKPIADDRVPPELCTEVAIVLAEMALMAAHTQGAATC